ncbi:hypothetical protein [Herbaspirillum huttiense]|uniref:hypothetical protein n=1 Tax=Herbaspirillum huttiense TaxID=863372 RepID=UPI003CEB84BA
MSTNLHKRLSPGFGQRLREERERLEMSQTQFGEIGGIGRLAQRQYESETTSPTIRYMTAIERAGVDINYVLFGAKTSLKTLTASELDRIEERAYRWVEAVAERRPDGKLDSTSRRFLCQVIQKLLIQIEQGALPADTDVASLIPLEPVAGERR